MRDNRLRGRYKGQRREEKTKISENAVKGTTPGID